MPTARVRDLAFLPDGQSIVTLGNTGSKAVMVVWDLKTGRRRREIDTSTRVTTAMALSPDASQIAYDAGGKGQVHIRSIDAPQNAKPRTLEGASKRIYQMEFSGDGRTLVGRSSSGVVVWDVPSGKKLRTIANALGMTLNPDGTLLACHPWDARNRKKQRPAVVCYDPRSGEVVKQFGQTRQRITQIAFSPDGKRVAALEYGQPRRALIWDVESGEKVGELAWKNSTAVRLYFADSQRLVTVGSDPALSVHDVATGKTIHSIRRPTRGYGPIALDRQRNRAMLARTGHALELIDLKTGKLLNPRQGHSSALLCAAACGDVAATAGGDGTVRLWDAATGRRERVIKTGSQRPAILRFGPDGRRIVRVDSTGAVSLIDPDDGSCHKLGKMTGVTSATFEPGGRMLRLGTRRMETGVWDLQERKLVRRHKGVERYGGAVVHCLGMDYLARTHQGRYELRAVRGGESGFTPLAQDPIGTSVGASATSDGQWVAFVGNQGFSVHEARSGHTLLSISTGRPARMLHGIALRPDGRLLAGVFADGKIQLWDLATSKRVASLQGHSSHRSRARRFRSSRGATMSVAFTPDGQRLITAGSDATALLWDVAGLVRDTEDDAPADLQAAWDDLADGQRQEVAHAVWQMILAGDRAVEWLAERLEPAREPDRAEIASLIDALDDDRYVRRMEAQHRLAELGPLVRKPLRRAASGESTTEELAARIENLLEQIDSPLMTSPSLLRGVRSVTVLDRIGTSAARALLADLAEGAKEAPLTRAARRVVR
jgi:WD40 repeat protein